MYIAKNIRYLRKRADMTQLDVARKMGYKASATVNKWEMGENIPPAKALDALSQMFNISVDRLMYADLQADTASPIMRQSVSIPVFASVHAGIPDEMIDEIVDREDIPADWVSGQRQYFGLKVRGDSMMPEYRDGDTIIVRHQPDCESGDDCIVRVNGDDAVLRRVIKNGSQVVFQPLNSVYAPYVATGAEGEPSITIAGVVVELRRTMR